MFSLKQFVVLALVGTAFASPIARRDDGYEGPYGRWQGNQGWKQGTDDNGIVVSGETVDIVTVTIYPDYTPSSTMATVTATYVPSVPSAAPVTTTAAAVASSAPAAAPSVGSDDGSWLSIVNKWRAAGGLPTLTEDATLVANAKKTATDDDGTMKHELNPGTMAQVLAPGNANNFESVYVGGWLCEEPNLPGLDGICSTAAQGWDHSDGETGHAQILTSKSYTKIGCDLETGIWACDLA